MTMIASDPWRRETDSSTGRAYFWHPATGEARCHGGHFVDEERAALAYNEAVIAADLQHLRPMNRVDASGRPIPKDQD